MEKARFYQRLQTIAEYLILVLVFGLLIYGIGHKFFQLSILESIGAALVLILIRWLYKVMGGSGKGRF